MWTERFLECAGIVFDPQTRRLRVGRDHVQRLRLNPTEARLLTVLMTNPRKLLSREFLMREVWETDFTDDTRTLEVHICWLRRKLGESAENPRYIKTVRGVGYIFDPN